MHTAVNCWLGAGLAGCISWMDFRCSGDWQCAWTSDLCIMLSARTLNLANCPWPRNEPDVNLFAQMQQPMAHSPPRCSGRSTIGVIVCSVVGSVKLANCCHSALCLSHWQRAHRTLNAMHACSLDTACARTHSTTGGLATLEAGGDLATAAWVAATLATVFTGDALPTVALAGAGLAGGATDFAGCEPEASGGDLAAGAPDFAGCEPEALGGDLAGGGPDFAGCELEALGG